MTYKQFEAIAKEFRPDVMVSRHGDFWSGDSKWRLGIVFVGEDGKQSRVYKYGGSYQEVLAKLGIETVTKEQIEIAKAELARCKENHGKPNIFFGGTMDYAKQIEMWQNELKKYEAAVKVWEY